MAAATSSGPGGRGRLPARARDHRGALTALALLLVVAGALGSALVVYRSGHRTDVLVAAHDIKAGQQVSDADLTVARVATDSGSVVPASDEHAYIGTFATTSIPAGTLINHLMFQVGSVLPANGVVVGVTLTADQRPAADLSAGDVVRAYLVPKTAQTGTAITPGPVLVDAARVTDVQQSSSGDTVTVSLLVRPADAQNLIYAAAQGSVALASLPGSTIPAIDFQTGP